MHIRIIQLKSNEVLAEIYNAESVDIPMLSTEIEINDKVYSVVDFKRSYEKIPMGVFDIDGIDTGHMFWYKVYVQ